MELPASKLVKNQKKIFTKVLGDEKIKVELRYDDECGNGHNSFSATCSGWEKRGGRWEETFGGCAHEEIVRFFPDLAKYMKWHLTSSDGPMHYPGNVTYHAGDRDCWGTRKGEVRSYDTHIKFGDFPITFELDTSFMKWLQGLENFDLEIMAVEHKNREGDNYKFSPHYTFLPYGDGDWFKCPFDTEMEANNFLLALQNYPVKFVKVPASWGEGQERNFEAARSCAVWPEATDEQLSLDKPELEKLLMARLPALMQEFKHDMEELGFEY